MNKPSKLNQNNFGNLVRVALLLSLCTVACSAKKIIISGQVVDSSGLPIQRAEVVTTPATDIVTTDDKGFFYLTRRVVQGTGKTEDIPASIYQIQVSKEGYEPLRFSIKAEQGNVWAERQTMQSEQTTFTRTKPESSEDDSLMPTGGGGMVGF